MCNQFSNKLRLVQMFNKFYYGITIQVRRGSLRGGLDLFLAAPGLPQDGHNGGAVIFHMLLECLPQADTLGVATTTHKHNVQMLPDVV